MLQEDQRVPSSGPASAASRQANLAAVPQLPSVGPEPAEVLSAAETAPGQVSCLCCKNPSVPTQLQAAPP